MLRILLLNKLDRSKIALIDKTTYFVILGINKGKLLCNHLPDCLERAQKSEIPEKGRIFFKAAIRNSDVKSSLKPQLLGQLLR